MSLQKPVQMIILGGVMVVLGWVLPFLMVIQVIPSTFFLNFFSFGISVIGVMLGIVGSVFYFRGSRRK